MKAIKFLIGLVIVLGIVLVPAKPVSAMALSLTSCMQIQNLDTGTADIIMTFYTQGTEAAVNVPDSITGSSSKTYCNISALTPGFVGSAVVSSNVKVAVIANLASPDYLGMNASYGGASAGALSANVPLVKKNDWGYSTQFSVQNAGTADATVNVTYTDGVTASQVIPAGRSYTFDQSLEAHVDPSPATNGGWVGAATVTSNQPIVVVNLESNNSVLFAYNGFTPTQASTNPLFPMVQANWYTYFTGIALQNTGTQPTDVTIAYTATISGTSCTETKTVPTGGMVAFAVTAWGASDTNTDNNCVNGEAFVGSAQVITNSTNQPLVGIVNELSPSKNKGGAYTGFNPSSGTDSILFPLITDHNYGYFTGFSLINVGDTAVDITCTYSGTPTRTQSTTNVPVGGAWTISQFNLFYGTDPAFASGYVGSGTCVATKTAGSAGGTNAALVGALNYLKEGTTTDTLSVSEGINQ